MRAADEPVIVDDRLLIEELLAGLPKSRPVAVYTTSSWYYRACRAAVLGAGGHLSGPFHQLEMEEQETAGELPRGPCLRPR